MADKELANNVLDAVMTRMVMDEKERLHNYRNPVDIQPPQKYKLGEEVKVQSWTAQTVATITAVEWIFHHRLGSWCWGYSVDKPTGLSFTFIPEGYLHRLGEK